MNEPLFYNRHEVDIVKRNFWYMGMIGGIFVGALIVALSTGVYEYYHGLPWIDLWINPV